MRGLFDHLAPAITEDERSALILGAEKQVRAAARKLARSWGRSNEADEFEADAVLYAIEAFAKWNPSRGVQFPTYAVAFAKRSLIRKHARPSIQAFIGKGLDGMHGEIDDATEQRPAITPNAEQLAILGSVNEPARTYVRLVQFEGLSPARVADQVGRDVKDVKLSLRNAYEQMCWMIDDEEAEESQSLFGQIIEE